MAHGSDSHKNIAGFNFREEEDPLLNVPIRNNKPHIPEDSASSFSSESSSDRPGNVVAMDRSEFVGRGISRGPLKGLDLSKHLYPWRIMQQLAQNLPLNEFKLPTMIYRPDMLDFPMLLRAFDALRLHDFAHSTTTTVTLPPEQGGGGIHRIQILIELQEMLRAAEVQLDYAEGYPMLPNGFPIWSRLDFEADDAYHAFMEYLNLDGVRMIADIQGYPLELAQNQMHMNYWLIRVKAYEIYKVAGAHRRRVKRMLTLDDDHYAQAEKMMGKLRTYFEGVKLDTETLPPDKAVVMFEKLAKIQRVAAGLSATGEKEAENPGKIAPVDLTMRKIAERSEGEARESAELDIDILNDRPDLLDAAQDLILNASDITYGDDDDDLGKK